MINSDFLPLPCLLSFSDEAFSKLQILKKLLTLGRKLYLLKGDYTRIWQFSSRGF